MLKGSHSEKALGFGEVVVLVQPLGSKTDLDRSLPFPRPSCITYPRDSSVQLPSRCSSGCCWEVTNNEAHGFSGVKDFLQHAFKTMSTSRNGGPTL